MDDDDPSGPASAETAQARAAFFDDGRLQWPGEETKVSYPPARLRRGWIEPLAPAEP